MIRHTLLLFALAAFAVPLLAGPALAGPASPPPAGNPVGAEPGSPVFAASYWTGFVDHWTEVLQKQNGIVMLALLVGAVCLFIITRGKWRK